MITPAVLAEAWRLRRMHAFSMRDIAEALGVDRAPLIDAMNANPDPRPKAVPSD